MATQKYNTVLTGSGFLMAEFRQIVRLKLDGLSNEEIKTKVFDENIFQYNKTASIKRAFPYLLQRIESLDEELMKMVVEEDIQTAKTINLYSIMKTNLLFYEFMKEVVEDLIQYQNSVLEKKDVNVFFTNKAEQSDFIRNLAESTVKRLQSAFLKVLIEAGILRDLKSRELKPLIIDELLKRHLTQIGDSKYLRAIGDFEG